MAEIPGYQLANELMENPAITNVVKSFAKGAETTYDLIIVAERVMKYNEYKIIKQER